MPEGAEPNPDPSIREGDGSIVGSVAEEYERALQVHRPEDYVLTLYVAGAAPRSLRAIANIRRLCEKYLAGCHELLVVDIYQEPASAEREGILAVPALVKQSPPPVRSFVGDMSDLDRVLAGLGLSRKAEGEE